MPGLFWAMTGELMSQFDYSTAQETAGASEAGLRIRRQAGVNPSRRHFLSSVVAVASGASMMAVSSDAQGQERRNVARQAGARVPSVLAFGDSNTWGYIPRVDEGPTRYSRYDPSIRWPMVLERAGLGRFRVIEHGICGLVGGLASGEARFEDGTSRAAIDHIRGVILASWPVDELVVMLGTNDLAYPALSQPEIIAPKIAATVQAALESHRWIGGKAPAVTLVSPIPLGRQVTELGIAEEAITRSRQLAPPLAEQAGQNGWRFLDAAMAGELETVDGIHWDVSQHRRFAEMLGNVIFT